MQKVKSYRFRPLLFFSLLSFPSPSFPFIPFILFPFPFPLIFISFLVNPARSLGSAVSFPIGPGGGHFSAFLARRTRLIATFSFRALLMHVLCAVAELNMCLQQQHRFSPLVRERHVLAKGDDAASPRNLRICHCSLNFTFYRGLPLATVLHFPIHEFRSRIFQSCIFSCHCTITFELC